MFKRIFQFSSSEREAALAGRNGSAAAHAAGIAELNNALQRESERTPPCAAVEHQGVSPVFESFEDVYLSAGIKTAGKAYTILKVAEMVNSRHLADMTPEAKSATFCRTPSRATGRSTHMRKSGRKKFAGSNPSKPRKTTSCTPSWNT